MSQARDTRFFPGYTWVSESPGCETGLCMPSIDPERAARIFLKREMTYHNAGRTFTVYTMRGPAEEPRRVEITV